MKSPMVPRQQGHNPNQPTSVYVLTCEGRVKIGIAADTRARVANLQLSCPLPIAIAFERLFPTRVNARLVERSLHSRFGDSRIHGEWFVMDAAVAIAALQEAVEAPPPVTIPGRFQRPAPVASPPITYQKPAVRVDSDGPTWDELEAMDDETWNEFMRPCAATLDFLNPDYGQVVDELRAKLRAKYPQYYARALAL